MAWGLQRYRGEENSKFWLQSRVNRFEKDGHYVKIACLDLHQQLNAHEHIKSFI